MFEVESLIYPPIFSNEAIEGLGRLRTSRHIFRIDFFKDLEENIVAQVK